MGGDGNHCFWFLMERFDIITAIILSTFRIIIVLGG